MPIDKAALKEHIAEVTGGDSEFAKFLEEKYLANDAAATSFMGGFMRNRDYTQKSQALATDRGVFEQERRAYDGQIQQYKQMLEAAEAEKAKIMKDLAAHKVTVAQSQARLKHLKEFYNLSDEDVPNIPEQIETYQKGKVVDSSTDLDEKLAAFEKAFEKKITTFVTERLVPELGGMAQLDIVWNDIRDEHRELTGKRLTAKEAQELLNEADKRGRAGRPISLKAMWEEKYDAPSLRQKHHDDDFEKKLREKWDSEQAAKISEAAMQGIRPGMQQQGLGLRTSQIFDHKFKVHEEAEPQAVPKLRETSSAAERQALSGSERAAKKWIERRGAGIPIGAPDERRSGKVA